MVFCAQESFAAAESVAATSSTSGVPRPGLAVTCTVFTCHYSYAGICVVGSTIFPAYFTMHMCLQSNSRGALVETTGLHASSHSFGVG